eukprot:COSAG06_NODE_1670_length_8750_cov_3.198821_8_plen_303_part_00
MVAIRSVIIIAGMAVCAAVQHRSLSNLVPRNALSSRGGPGSEPTVKRRVNCHIGMTPSQLAAGTICSEVTARPPRGPRHSPGAPIAELAAVVVAVGHIRLREAPDQGLAAARTLQLVLVHWAPLVLAPQLAAQGQCIDAAVGGVVSARVPQPRSQPRAARRSRGHHSSTPCAMYEYLGTGPGRRVENAGAGTWGIATESNKPLAAQRTPASQPASQPASSEDGSFRAAPACAPVRDGRGCAAPAAVQPRAVRGPRLTIDSQQRESFSAASYLMAVDVQVHGKVRASGKAQRRPKDKAGARGL